MNVFERMSGFLAGGLAGKLGVDQQQKDVLAYGAYSILYTAWSIFLLFVTGLIMDTMGEIIVLSTASSILRRYSGGAHATSPHRCAMTGVVVFGVLAFGVKLFAEFSYLYMVVYFAVAYGIARYLIWRHAPVDTPTKPIRDEQRKMQFKRMSNRVVDVSFGTILAFGILNRGKPGDFYIWVSLAISTGLLWQAFTLTTYGNMFINFFDKILKIEGREKT